MGNLAAISLSIAAAVIPTVLHLTILWWFDRYEREPRALLQLAFWWGALIASILAYITERSLAPSLAGLGSSLGEIAGSSVLAPVVEEVCKALGVLLLFILANSEFDDALDGIIYGATVGFGFAMTENALYFLRSLSVGGLQSLTLTVFMRAFVFGVNHALFTCLFGAALGHIRATRRGHLSLPTLGLLGGIFLHAVHNLFAVFARQMCFALVISFVSDWGSTLLVVVAMLLVAGQEKRWIEEKLRPEVASGLLSQEEYEVIGSYRKRVSAGWRVRQTQGPAAARQLGKLTQLATELAFKLHQGDESRAQKLREEIIKLRASAA